MLQEIGIKTSLVCKIDASAAQGIALRRGLGRVKHIEVTQLWLQDKVAEGKIKIKKVGTKENLSDALTKGLPAGDIMWHMESTKQFVCELTSSEFM